MNLASRTCVPCQGGMTPLPLGEQNALALQLHSDWNVVAHHHLSRTYKFPDFAQGLAWVNRIGALAEEQGHHPDIYLAWGEVRVEIWTHKTDGLHEADFILAAKMDAMS